MIALRARRQAWDIAYDIAYPHVDVPPSVAPSETVETRSPPDTEIAFPPRDVSLFAELRNLPRWAEWLIAVWAILMVVGAVLIFPVK